MASGFPELAFLRIILILIAGGKPNLNQTSRIHAGLYPDKTAAYAHIDANRMRALISSDKALKKAILGGNTAEAYKQAVTQLRIPGLTSAYVEKKMSKMRGVGAWYLGFPRFLIVADFGDGIEIMDIVKMFKKQDNHLSYSKETYAGFTLHALTKRRGQSLWIGEANGFAAFAMEPISVKKFLLTQTDKKIVEAAPKRNSIAQMIVRPDMFLKGVMAREFVGYYLGTEELAALNVFDLAAYKDLTAEVTKDGLTARLGLHGASQAGKLLKPSKKPFALAPLLPKKNGLAIAVQIDNSQDLAKHIEMSTSVMARNNETMYDMMMREANRELGIDLKKDLIDNIQSAAYICTKLANERDLERRGIFAFHAKDEKAAKVTFYKFVSHIDRRGDSISEKFAGGEYLEMNRGRLKLGICKDLVLLGFGRELDSKNFRTLLTTKLNRKAAKDETPLASATLDLSGVTGRQLPPAAATLTRKGDIAKLTMKLDVAKFLTAFFSGSKGNTTTGYSPFAKSRIINNSGNLKQIGLACLMYSGDNNGDFPPNFKALMDQQILNAGKVYQYINPGTGATDKKYIYFPGFKDDDVQATRRIIAADPTPYNGKRCALFIDGHVELISEQVFRQRLKEQKIAIKPAIKKSDIPKADQAAIRKLCLQLGSQSFKDRRAAKKKLKAMGTKAFVIIEEFKNHKDPEIRAAIRQLLNAL